MNHPRKLITIAAVGLLASLSAVRAQTTTLAGWTFDNSGIVAPVIHPAPSSGVDIATAVADTVGMTNTLTPTPSIGQPDVIANPAVNADSTPLLPDAWRIRAKGTSPNTGNGWSDAAAVGSQGAIFKAGTVGYQNIKLTFDITATTAGEGYFQVEYTTDGVIWSNAALTYLPNQALVLTNATPGTGTNDLVVGVYFSMVETGTFAQVWYTNVTADLSGISAANNNPNFAVKIVNAAKGTNCSSAANAALNNTSGNWSIDNVVIAGTPPPVAITAWDFDTYLQGVLTNSPVPSLGAGTATPLGMNNSYNSATSLASCDITATAGASTGNGSAAWRIRGGGGTFGSAGTPNGWSSQAPLGTQGAEFDVNTVGYNNITLAFDIYYTAAAPAQTQVQYTTDGINWSNATTLAYAPNPAFILTNTTDPNTCTGTYFSQTAGSAFYTNLTASFPAAASGNANFGVRIVNATTGPDSLTFGGAAYNNSSGNWRFDNVIISGTTGGSGGLSTPPALTPASGISVTSGSFAIAIPVGNSVWQSGITNITVGGVTLVGPTFTNGITITPTQITFNMSASIIYQTAGNLSIVIGSTGFSHDTVTQVLLPGVATQMVLASQPVAPTGDGGTLVVQPSLVFKDVYNNVATGTVATVTATVGGSGTWTLGGAVVQPTVAGTVNYTNLLATNPAAAFAGATITLTATGSGVSPNFVTSTAFNIPAPSTAFTAGNLVVEQEDLATKNSTFSMLELSPTISNQSIPVNTFPVPATATNGLRQASSGSTGRVADSDDGTLVCFSAALCSDSTVSDATTVDPRGAGTFDYTGKYTLQAVYVGLGDSTANQTRSAVSIDNTNWFMGDKGGVYTNGNNGLTAYIPYSVNNPANVRSLKSFGGTIFVMQQEGGTDPISTVLDILPDPSGMPQNTLPGAPANGSQSLFPLEGFPIDGSVLDFYLVRSGNNGNVYDVAYYIDGTNTTSGAIFKLYYTGQTDGNTGQQIWNTAGSWPTPNGGDGLCARTNATGGVDLYYTTGNGGVTGNSVIAVHDSSAWNQPINLTATNTLYTVSALATLKGIAFAPINPNPAVVTTPFSIITSSPKFTGAPGTSSAAFSFSFNNAAGLSSSFTILETTNIALPLSQWQVLGHPTEGSPGLYQFSDTSATNGARFYTIRQP